MALLKAVLLLCLSWHAKANIYSYSGDKDVLRSEEIQFRRLGMWTPQDAPSASAPGNGRSFIRMEVSFKRKYPVLLGLLQMVIYHADDADKIGWSVDDQGTIKKMYCCSPALKEMSVPGCDRIGQVIVQPETRSIWTKDVTFFNNQSAASVSEQYNVQQTGIHYLLFSICEDKTGDVEMTGKTSWMNPYGYLPAELYYFMPFFGWMCIAYLAVGIVWGLMCLMYREDLLSLQHCVSIVIGMAVLECAVWYFDYINFNNTGIRSMGPVVIGVMMSTIKKTVSRLLVLVVSLGYGVVRPTLGNTAHKVLLLGFVYFMFSAILDVVSNVSQMSEVSSFLRLVFIMPVALLDAFFYWWIFSALSRTLTQLTIRKQSQKLDLYKKFSQVLAGSIIFSGLWVMYQMTVIVSDGLDSRWDTMWVFEAFWQVLYMGVLVSIAVLWSPNQNNLQYAYSEQLSMGDDDDEADGMEMQYGDAKFRGQNDAPSHAFGLEDEDDEDEKPNASKTT